MIQNKDFKKWFKIKPNLDKLEKYPRFETGEIWWCHLGENVGHEENGKGEEFLRPVIILKKFNQRLFYGLPTTTKIKDNKYYYKFSIKGVEQSALLSQLRIIDAVRLSYKLGKLPEPEFRKINKACQKLFDGK